MPQQSQEDTAQVISDLQSKLMSYKKREKALKEDLEMERQQHFQTKLKADTLIRRIQELTAYQNTLQSYFHHEGNSKTQSTNFTGFKSSNEGLQTEEPVPAFLKAIQNHFFSNGGLLSMDSVTSIAEEAQACVKDRPKS